MNYPLRWVEGCCTESNLIFGRLREFVADAGSTRLNDLACYAVAVVPPTSISVLSERLDLVSGREP